MAARNATSALLIAYAPLIGHHVVEQEEDVRRRSLQELIEGGGATIGDEAEQTTTTTMTTTTTPSVDEQAQQERAAWEAYAMDHADWILRGHLFHPQTSALFATTTTTDAAVDDTNNKNKNMTLQQQQQQQQDAVLASITSSIPAKIWRYNDETGIDEVERGPPPYSPAWQLSPPPYDNSIVNFNYYASRSRGGDEYRKLVQATLENYNDLQQPKSDDSAASTSTTTPVWERKQWLLSEPFDTRTLYGNALPKNPDDANTKSLYDLEPVDSSSSSPQEKENDESNNNHVTPQYAWDGVEPLASPQSIVMVPVVSSLIGSMGLGGGAATTDNRYNKVAGHISAAIPWTTVLFSNVRYVETAMLEHFLWACLLLSCFEPSNVFLLLDLSANHSLQLLPRETNESPIHLVVESSCPSGNKQVHTYELLGLKARYVGPGDWHEPAYSEMVYTAPLNPYMPPPPPPLNLTELHLRLEQLRNQSSSTNNGPGGVVNSTEEEANEVEQANIMATLNASDNETTRMSATNETQASPEDGDGLICQHMLFIYPTKAYQDYHETNTPLVYTLTVFLVLIFAIFLFLIYDFVVRRQQNKVLGEAERSNAIIASLFPTQVARKLFVDGNHHHNTSSRGVGLDLSAAHMEAGGNEAKKRSNFRNRADAASGGGMFGSSSGFGGSSDLDKLGKEGGRPIAELFPEATVMFVSISVGERLSTLEGTDCLTLYTLSLISPSNKHRRI